MAAHAAPASERTRRGAHYLRNRRVAASIAACAAEPGHLVVEVGAGYGAITSGLVSRGADVVAVEIDHVAAEALRRRFGERVRVVEGDALRAALPSSAFTLAGNVPFHITTALLRRVLDGSWVERVVVLVQWEAARKRTTRRPSTMLASRWHPWFSFEILRRVPASNFSPRPRRDGAVLLVRRREVPLLAPRDRRAFEALLRRAYSPSCRPLTIELRGIVTRRQLHRIGVAPDARAIDVDPDQWVEFYRRLT